MYHLQNKRLAIEQAEIILLRNNKEWCSFFSKKEKRDDLADCFLQNLAYMKFILKI